MRRLIKDNVPEIIKILLKELKFKHTDTTINKFKKNPYFPDLIAISQELSRLSIENIAIKANYDQLRELPKPFIVHMNDNGGMYLVVEEVNSNNIIFIVENNRKETQTKDDFIKSWSNSVLVVNTEGYSAKEKKYSINLFKQRLRNLRLILITISIVFFLYVFFEQRVLDYYLIIFKILSLIGTIVSILLLIQSVDKNNLFIKKICNAKKNKRINCSSILNSKAANLFGIISWSEIGATYFLSQVLIFTLFKDISNSFIYLISILVSPYIIYSIFYQWKVAKVWCKLCLGIQLVLLLQAIISSFLLFNSKVVIREYYSYDFILIVAFPILILTLISYILPLFTELTQKRELLKLSNRIRMQPDVFYSQLKKSKEVNLEPILDKMLVYESEKTNQILLVINPTCQPCIELHSKILEILSYNKDVQVNEVFLVEKENVESYDLAIKMTDIYLAESEEYFKESIVAYYKDYLNKGNKWSKKYWKPIYRTDKSSKVLEDHFKWCLSNGITSTPQIIYNGKFLPPEYNGSDLDYLLY